ncbi:MAG: hypothetical protein M5U28_12925 [Sandaracinaceae bacterium]|nr:hypothetical protein [Sandaracinaceae bacterium]
MNDIDELSRSELIALAGLLRAVIRIDGRFSDAERDALAQVAQMVAEEREGARRGGDTYRESNPLEPIGEDRLFAILDEAGTTLADDAAIRAAALAVTRPEARERHPRRGHLRRERRRGGAPRAGAARLARPRVGPPRTEPQSQTEANAATGMSSALVSPLCSILLLAMTSGSTLCA